MVLTLVTGFMTGFMTGCPDKAEPSRRPVARIGALVLDASVVEQIATRDGLSETEARQRALSTLRLAAAGRQQHAASGEDPGPVLSERRATHLRRAARARLWLEERFEPAHGPDQIPADDPRLVRARLDPRLVHPEIHSVCQVVVEPPNVDDLDAKAEITADPQWQDAARATLVPVLKRIERTVPLGDPEACRLIGLQVQLSEALTDPRLQLSFPKPGGFDLDACIQIRPSDGHCLQPRFDPQWTAVVRAMETASLSAPLFTRFGLHVVYLHERLPAQPADDPATESVVRASVLDAWRAEQLDLRLQQMSQRRSVRMVRPSDAESPTPQENTP